MALGGSISDFFAIEAVAPWLYQAPGSQVGGGLGSLFWDVPAQVITPEIALGWVDQALEKREPQLATIKPSFSSITEGEQVGYADFDVPLGPTNPEAGPIDWVDSVLATVAGTYLPEVGSRPVGAVPDESAPFPGAPVSDRPSFPEGSIYGPGGTWGESPLPPDIYDIPFPDTGPNELPPTPIPEEGGPATRDVEGESDMAVDWGDFLSNTAQSVITGFVGGGAGATPGIVPGAVAPPARVTVDTRTGAVTPCRRRRRRRLLTSSDLNDLAALKTIVGGGQALNGAVIKAVRR